MQKNETVLTPVYRYVLEVLESKTIDAAEKISQITRFKNHLRGNVSSITGDADNYLIIDSVIEFLQAMSLEDGGKSYWNHKLEELQKEKCRICSNCRSCKLYFWKELGELFYEVQNDQKQQKQYLPVRQLPEEILKHLEPSVGMSELYYSRIKWKKSSTFHNKFVMLKGMSSSTPPMLNNIFDTEEFVGGGFYFNWEGYGVVIDPGYYFIKNLHRMGLSVLDIDAVVITHEHIDHNNDMRLLDDLHYSIARYNKQNGKTHVINWYMDKVSYDIALTWRRNGAGFNAKANNLHRLAPNEEYEFKADELFLETFPTKHIWDSSSGKYHNHTVGTKFRCKSGAGETVIVYTSDTRYYQELVDFVRDADAVIANISGIYEDDYTLVKEKNTHLGYYGCFNLIKECYERHHRYPSFYFLSEFWNGKSDIRYDVAKCLRKDLNAQKITQIKVIPAEVGIIFDMEHCKIQCSQCGAFSDQVIVKKPASMKEKVEVLCSECCF